MRQKGCNKAVRRLEGIYLKYSEIIKNEEVLAYIRKGNEKLGMLGYTDHSEVHTAIVAKHAAILAVQILEKAGMSLEDRVEVMSVIGNHDESTGGAYDAISAALIIADKTDVRRNRVRNTDLASFDIHDRVNYAVTEAKLKLNTEKSVISLNLKIDENICTMYEYFDIFLGRMMMCRKAAEILGARFKLTANGSKVL